MLASLPLLALLSCQATEHDSAADDSAADTADSTHTGESGETGDSTPPELLCPDGLPTAPWDPTGAGAAYYDVAGDVVVPTTLGDWTLSSAWTGCDAVFFLVVSGDDGYTSTLLGQKDTAVRKLFRDGPQNVHYVFVVNGVGKDWDNTFASLQTTLDDGYAALDGDLQAWWADRIHLATVQPGRIGGWFSDRIGGLAFGVLGVDRRQQVREVGYLADPTADTTEIDWTYLHYEPDLWNFEARREAELAAQDATVLPVLDDAYVSDSGWAGVTTKAEVAFPDAATMAGFDRMQVDLTLDCGGDWYEACPAWDYLAYVYLCDNDDPETADVDESTSCVEMNRFITAYWRGGRWVMDASAFLAEVQDGGTHTLRVYSTQPYYVDLSVRLWNAGTGTRPASMQYLWSGGGWDETYNDAHPPILFTPPEGTTRVRLVTTITGHGFGSNRENCAEFCTSEHEFTVNDAAPHLEEILDPDETLGCAEQVATRGVTPNQAGTWPFGRNGWCPGLGIEPWSVDITADVKMGQENTIAYRALRDGEPYDPTVTNTNFPARLDMTSWLVFEHDE